jgi:molybdenum cofactor cytidylyltransferase
MGHRHMGEQEAGVEPIGLDAVVEALGLGRGRQHVAVVGGGGKTTLVHALGATLRGRTVLTTTTKMGADQDRLVPLLVSPTDAEVAAAVAPGRPVMVWEGVDGHRALGVSPQRCDAWFAMADAVDHVVIEADGSRRRPFKAPAPHEPVVPATITLMASVIGVSALGGRIVEVCHRPELVAGLTGAAPTDELTPARAARVLLHPDGARRALPSRTAFAVVVARVGPSDVGAATALRDELMALEPGVAVVAVRDEAEAASHPAERIP